MEEKTNRIGYARISDKTQEIGTQVDQLKKFGVDRIVKEIITGVAEEKKLNKLIEEMEPGQSLVVTRMDRLGRSALQLLALVEDLQERGIELIILDLNVDTSTHTGKFFLTVMAAFAELDRQIIKAKTKDGIEREKALDKKRPKDKRKYKGRQAVFTKHSPKVKSAIELYKLDKYSVRQIATMTGVGKSTLYKLFKEFEESGMFDENEKAI